MELSLKLSIASLIISICTVVFEYFYNKRINSINIDATYFNEIYKDYLINIIPESRVKISLTGSGRISGVDDFLDVLREMRKKSLFFKYKDDIFYKELIAKIQGLEDELVMVEDELENSTYNQFVVRIDYKIDSIYKFILDTMQGKPYWI